MGLSAVFLQVQFHEMQSEMLTIQSLTLTPSWGAESKSTFGDGVCNPPFNTILRYTNVHSSVLKSYLHSCCIMCLPVTRCVRAQVWDGDGVGNNGVHAVGKSYAVAKYY